METQRGRPALWCLVDPAAPIKARRFRLAGTGHPIHAGPMLRFIGTFLMAGDDLVFHLFEITEDR